MNSSSILEILRRRFDELQAMNRAFSLRAYAERLEMGSGALSEILKGKRKITDRMVREWLKSPVFDPQERAAMAHAFGHAESGGTATTSEYRKITRAQWQVIAEWWHFAILNLIRTVDFQSDPSWIARRLGLRSDLVKSALHRLEQLGLIEQDAAGQWKRSSAAIRTPDDRADTAIQKAHADLLQIAERRLKRVPVQERDYTSLIMAIPPERVPMAKEMIRKFQDDLSAALESPDATEVYQLGIQLFPLSVRTD